MIMIIIFIVISISITIIIIIIITIIIIIFIINIIVIIKNEKMNSNMHDKTFALSEKYRMSSVISKYTFWLTSGALWFSFL